MRLWFYNFFKKQDINLDLEVQPEGKERFTVGMVLELLMQGELETRMKFKDRLQILDFYKKPIIPFLKEMARIIIEVKEKQLKQ